MGPQESLRVDLESAKSNILVPVRNRNLIDNPQYRFAHSLSWQRLNKIVMGQIGVLPTERQAGHPVT
jgi:hypothetical protein